MKVNSLQHMTDALSFIEENLTNEIDVNEVATRALCSEYHFKRMLSFLAGVTLSEYIRRRRLTLAAFELNDRESRIIDMAMKYGYDSPDAFTRAFHHVHGITPSEARNNGHIIKSYPQMTFQLSVKGGHAMTNRIEEIDEFKIVGIHEIVTIVFHVNKTDIASMWESIDEKAIKELKNLSDVEPRGLIGASTKCSEGRKEEKGTREHYIGEATTNKPPSN